MSTDHNFLRERRAKVDLNWGPSAYQPNALPLGQAGSLGWNDVWWDLKCGKMVKIDCFGTKCNCCLLLLHHLRIVTCLGLGVAGWAKCFIKPRTLFINDRKHMILSCWSIKSEVCLITVSSRASRICHSEFGEMLIVQRAFFGARTHT